MKKLYTAVVDLAEAKSVTGSTYVFDYEIYPVLVNSTNAILLNVPFASGSALRCVSCVLSIGSFSPGQVNACGAITDTTTIKNIRVYAQRTNNTLTIVYPA